MSKLKDMVSSVTRDRTDLNVKEITSRLNKRYNKNISEKEISDFLHSHYYTEEEIEYLERKHKGFNGKFYT